MRTSRSQVVLESIADAIGNTPLLNCSRLVSAAGVDGRLLLKLDYLNPGFSKKDRIAREMVERALADGQLAAGQPIVELTSGNTGTGLAIVCQIMGHPFIAVMSRGNSTERARMMRALGAEVVLVAQAPGGQPGQVSGDDLAAVEAHAREITQQRGAFRADQFHLEANVLAHETHTGPELWAQSRGEIDAFCDFVGTGGTFTGTARALRARRPDIRCYVIEPERAAALSGQLVIDPGHRIQGGGYSMPELPLLDRSLVTDFVQIDDAVARRTSRDLARLEGVFAGYSTGANVAAALVLLGGPEAGNTVTCLACDAGLKYLSTDLWD